MAFSIRLATLGDYQAISELFAEVDNLHYQALPHIFAEAAACVRPKSRTAEILADENQALFVAEDQEEAGQVVGFIQVKVKYGP